MTAGDIACAPSSSSFNGGNGTSSKCRQLATSDLLLAGKPERGAAARRPPVRERDAVGVPGVVRPLLGPRIDSREHVPGRGQPRVPDPGRGGYYQYWQQRRVRTRHSGDERLLQLRPRRLAHRRRSTPTARPSAAAARARPGAVAARRPRGSPDASARLPPGTIRSSTAENATIKTNGAFKPLWDVLYQRGAEIVLNGHVHHYQRCAPRIPAGLRLRRTASGSSSSVPAVSRRAGRRFVVGKLQATAERPSAC